MTHKHPLALQKVCALLTAGIFALTSISMPVANAVPIAAESIQPEKTLMQDLTAIQVPAGIGKMLELYRGSTEEVLVLIQDAHSIPDAQRNIQKLIDYFQTQYGIPLTMLEGASKEFDPRIFRSFPDQDLLKQTFETFMDRGELAGGTAAAIFNPAESRYHGIEEWPLYEKGIGSYLKSMKLKDQRIEELAALESALQEEKNKIYSSELLEVDDALAMFRKDALGLLDAIHRLAQIKLPEANSELALLYEEWMKNGKVDASVEVEVKTIAGQVSDFLQSKSKNSNLQNELKKFQEKFQEFQTSNLNPEAFALELKELIIRNKIPIKVSKHLDYLTRNQKRIRDIQGTRLFEAFNHYAESIKENLFTTPEQKALNARGTWLEILNRLAKLELSQEDWKRIKDFGREAAYWNISRDGLYGVGDIEKLIKSMQPQFEFYQVAEQRDLAFLKNAESLMRRYQTPAALVVAGGFHSEGLIRNLREKKISYVLVMPAIEKIPEENFYAAHMRGDVSWAPYFEIKDGKVNLYDAFVRGVRDQLLSVSNSELPVSSSSTLNSKLETRNYLLKPWRDQIIRDLAANGKVADAGAYTRFMDEKNQDQFAVFKEKWLANIDRFIDKLRGLETKGELTETNILNLLKPAASQSLAIGSQLSPGELANVASLGRVDVVARPEGRERIDIQRERVAARSESRKISADEEQKVIEQAEQLAQGDTRQKLNALQLIQNQEASVSSEGSATIQAIRSRLEEELELPPFARSDFKSFEAQAPNGSVWNFEITRDYDRFAANSIYVSARYQDATPDENTGIFTIVYELDNKISRFYGTQLTGELQGVGLYEKIAEKMMVGIDAFYAVIEEKKTKEAIGQGVPVEETFLWKRHRAAQPDAALYLAENIDRKELYLTGAQGLEGHLKLTEWLDDHDSVGKAYLEALAGLSIYQILEAQKTFSHDVNNLLAAITGLEFTLEKDLSEDQMREFQSKLANMLAANEDLKREFSNVVEAELNNRQGRRAELKIDLRHSTSEAMRALVTSLEEIQRFLETQKVSQDHIDLLQWTIHQVHSNLKYIDEMNWEGAPEEVDVREVVREALASLQGYYYRSYASVTVETESGTPLNAYMDPDHIGAPIENVLRNAFRAFENLEKDPVRHQIKVSFEKTDDELIVRIADNADFIPQEKLEKIFERGFSDRKLKSTGLGLAIARDIVETAKGSIRAMNLPADDPSGMKVQFEIRLPITRSESRLNTSSELDKKVRIGGLELEYDVKFFAKGLNEEGNAMHMAIQLFPDLSEQDQRLILKHLNGKGRNRAWYLKLVYETFQSLSGDTGKPLRERRNFYRLDDLKKAIFEIGRKGNLMAHGIEVEKGGLRNLLMIFLEGKIKQGDMGPLAAGPTYLFAGPHGPFYVIIESGVDPTNWQEIKNHNAYLVPEAVDKQLLEQALKKAASQEIISFQQAKNISEKIFTYQAFVDKWKVSSAKSKQETHDDLAAARPEIKILYDSLPRSESRKLSKEDLEKLVTSDQEKVVWIHRTNLSEAEARDLVESQGFDFSRQSDLSRTASVMSEDPEEALANQNQGFYHRFKRDGVVIIMEFPRKELEAMSAANDQGVTPGEILKSQRMANRISNFFKFSFKVGDKKVIAPKYIRGFIVRDVNGQADANQYFENPNFGKDQAMPRSEERTVPKPSNIYFIHEENRDKWVMRHEGEMRGLAEIIARNITYISSVGFMAALKDSIASFNGAIENEPYVLIVEKLPETMTDIKSDLWVYALGREMGLREPEAIIARENLKEWLAENPHVKNIAIMDDAAYSGRQLKLLAEGAQISLSAASSQLHLHVLVPLMTHAAKQKIESVKFKKTFYISRTIMTFGEILEESGIGKDHPLYQRAHSVYENADNGTLTFLSYKNPDHVSSLSTRQTKEAVIETGVITNADGYVMGNEPFIASLNDKRYFNWQSGGVDNPYRNEPFWEYLNEQILAPLVRSETRKTAKEARRRVGVKDQKSLFTRRGFLIALAAAGATTGILGYLWGSQSRVPKIQSVPDLKFSPLSGFQAGPNRRQLYEFAARFENEVLSVSATKGEDVKADLLEAAKKIADAIQQPSFAADFKKYLDATDTYKRETILNEISQQYLLPNGLLMIHGEDDEGAFWPLLYKTDQPSLVYFAEAGSKKVWILFGEPAQQGDQPQAAFYIPESGIIGMNLKEVQGLAGAYHNYLVPDPQAKTILPITILKWAKSYEVYSEAFEELFSEWGNLIKKEFSGLEQPEIASQLIASTLNNELIHASNDLVGIQKYNLAAGKEELASNLGQLALGAAVYQELAWQIYQQLRAEDFDYAHEAGNAFDLVYEQALKEDLIRGDRRLRAVGLRRSDIAGYLRSLAEQMNQMAALSPETIRGLAQNVYQEVFGMPVPHVEGIRFETLTDHVPQKAAGIPPIAAPRSETRDDEIAEQEKNVQRARYALARAEAAADNAPQAKNLEDRVEAAEKALDAEEAKLAKMRQALQSVERTEEPRADKRSEMRENLAYLFDWNEEDFDPLIDDFLPEELEDLSWALKQWEKDILRLEDEDVISLQPKRRQSFENIKNTIQNLIFMVHQKRRAEAVSQEVASASGVKQAIDAFLRAMDFTRNFINAGAEVFSPGWVNYYGPYGVFIKATKQNQNFGISGEVMTYVVSRDETIDAITKAAHETIRKMNAELVSLFSRADVARRTENKQAAEGFINEAADLIDQIDRKVLGSYKKIALGAEQGEDYQKLQRELKTQIEKALDPYPDLATSLEEKLVQRSEIRDFSQIEPLQFVGPKMQEAFKNLNGNKELRKIFISGNYGATLPELQSQLASVPNEEFVIVALRNFYDEKAAESRVDYRLVIDRAGHIKQRIARFWMGDIQLEGYEFLFNVSVYPTRNTFHLHEMSLGREHGKALNNKQLAAEFFENFSAVLSQDFEGMKISTVAIEETHMPDQFQVIPHWMKKYFNARHAEEEELVEIQEYVNVDAVDLGAVYIGTIPGLLRSEERSAASKELSVSQLQQPVWAGKEKASHNNFTKIEELPADSRLRRVAEFLKSKGLSGIMIRGNAVRDMFITPTVPTQEMTGEVDIILRDQAQVQEFARALGKKEINVLGSGLVEDPETGWQFDILGWFNKDRTQVATFFGSHHDAMKWPDFTINTIGFTTEGEWIDPWNGIKDAANGTLRWMNPDQVPLSFTNVMRFLAYYHGFHKKGGYALDAPSIRAGEAQIREAFDKQSPRHSALMQVFIQAHNFKSEIEKEIRRIQDLESRPAEGVNDSVIKIFRHFALRWDIFMRVVKFLLADEFRKAVRDYSDGLWADAINNFHFFWTSIFWRKSHPFRVAAAVLRDNNVSWELKQPILMEAIFGDLYGPKLVRQRIFDLLHYSGDPVDAIRHMNNLGGEWIFDLAGMGLPQNIPPILRQTPEFYLWQMQAQFEEYRKTKKLARVYVKHHQLPKSRSEARSGMDLLRDPKVQKNFSSIAFSDWKWLLPLLENSFEDERFHLTKKEKRFMRMLLEETDGLQQLRTHLEKKRRKARKVFQNRREFSDFLENAFPETWWVGFGLRPDFITRFLSGIDEVFAEKNPDRPFTDDGLRHNLHLAVNRILNLLHFQLVPDDTPVFRSVEPQYLGFPAKAKKAYEASDWGFSELGLKTAIAYSQIGQVVGRSTFGEMRAYGFFIPDNLAFHENAVTFIHFSPDVRVPVTVVMQENQAILIRANKKIEELLKLSPDDVEALTTGLLPKEVFQLAYAEQLRDFQSQISGMLGSAKGKVKEGNINLFRDFFKDIVAMEKYKDNAEGLAVEAASKTDSNQAVETMESALDEASKFLQRGAETYSEHWRGRYADPVKEHNPGYFLERTHMMSTLEESLKQVFSLVKADLKEMLDRAEAAHVEKREEDFENLILTLDQKGEDFEKMMKNFSKVIVGGRRGSDFLKLEQEFQNQIQEVIATQPLVREKLADKFFQQTGELPDERPSEDQRSEMRKAEREWLGMVLTNGELSDMSVTMLQHPFAPERFVLYRADPKGKEIEPVVALMPLTLIKRLIEEHRSGGLKITKEDKIYNPEDNTIGIGKYPVVFPHEVGHWIFMRKLGDQSNWRNTQGQKIDVRKFWKGHFEDETLILQNTDTPDLVSEYQKLIGAQTPQLLIRIEDKKFAPAFKSSKTNYLNENIAFNIERLTYGAPFVVGRGAKATTEDLLDFFIKVKIISQQEKKDYLVLSRRLNNGRSVEPIPIDQVKIDVGGNYHLEPVFIWPAYLEKLMINEEMRLGRPLTLEEEISVKLADLRDPPAKIQEWLNSPEGTDKMIKLLGIAGALYGDLEQRIRNRLASSSETQRSEMRERAEGPNKALQAILEEFETKPLPKGAWIAAGDVSKGWHLNSALGPTAADWYFSLFKQTFAEVVEDVGLAGNTPGKGSDEFVIYFPPLTPKTYIKAAMARIAAGIIESFSSYWVVTLNQKLSPEQQEAFLEAKNTLGIQYVYSAGQEGEGRTKIIFNKDYDRDLLAKLREMIGKEDETLIVDIEALTAPVIPFGIEQSDGNETYANVLAKADQRLGKAKDSDRYGDLPLLLFPDEGQEAQADQEPAEPKNQELEWLLARITPKVDAVKKEASRTAEVLEQSFGFQANEKFGVFHRASLGEILTHVTSQKPSIRKPGVYLVLQPPNFFYAVIVHNDEQRSVELLAMDALFSSTEESSDWVKAVMQKILQARGGGERPSDQKILAEFHRKQFAEGKPKPVRGPPVGGKFLNGVMGDNHEAADHLIRVIVQTLQEILPQLIDQKVRHQEIADQISQSLQKKFDNLGLEVGFRVDMAQKDYDPQKKETIGRIIGSVTNLLKARDLIDLEKSVTAQGNVVKKISDYDPQEIAQAMNIDAFYQMLRGETELARYGPMMVQKVKNLLKEIRDDRDLKAMVAERFTPEERMVFDRVLASADETAPVSATDDAASRRSEMRKTGIPEWDPFRNIFTKDQVGYLNLLRENLFSGFENPTIFVPAGGSAVSELLALGVNAVIVDKLPLGLPKDIGVITPQEIRTYFGFKAGGMYTPAASFENHGRLMGFVRLELEKLSLYAENNAWTVEQINENTFRLNVTANFPGRGEKTYTYIFVGGTDLQDPSTWAGQAQAWASLIPTGQKQFQGVLMKGQQYMVRDAQDGNISVEKYGGVLTGLLPLMQTDAAIITDVPVRDDSGLEQVVAYKHPEIESFVESKEIKFGYPPNHLSAPELGSQAALLYRVVRSEDRQETVMKPAILSPIRIDREAGKALDEKIYDLRTQLVKKFNGMRVGNYVLKAEQPFLPKNILEATIAPVVMLHIKPGPERADMANQLSQEKTFDWLEADDIGRIDLAIVTDSAQNSYLLVSEMQSGFSYTTLIRKGILPREKWHPEILKEIETVAGALFEGVLLPTTEQWLAIYEDKIKDKTGIKDGIAAYYSSPSEAYQKQDRNVVFWTRHIGENIQAQFWVREFARSETRGKYEDLLNSLGPLKDYLGITPEKLEAVDRVLTLHYFSSLFNYSSRRDLQEKEAGNDDWWFSSTDESIKPYLDAAQGRKGVFIGAGGEHNLSILANGNYEFGVLFDRNPLITEIIQPFLGMVLMLSDDRVYARRALWGDVPSPFDADAIRRDWGLLAEHFIFRYFGQAKRNLARSRWKELYDDRRHFADFQKNNKFPNPTWVTDDAIFNRTKTLWLENRIIGITGDYSKAQDVQVVKDMISRARLKADTINLTNVLSHVSSPDARLNILDNLASLPRNKGQTLLLESLGRAALTVKTRDLDERIWLAKELNNTGANIALNDVTMVRMLFITELDEKGIGESKNFNQQVQFLKEAFTEYYKGRSSTTRAADEYANYLSLVDTMAQQGPEFLGSLSQAAFKDWMRGLPAESQVTTDTYLFHAFTTMLAFGHIIQRSIRSETRDETIEITETTINNYDNTFNAPREDLPFIKATVKTESAILDFFIPKESYVALPEEERLETVRHFMALMHAAFERFKKLGGQIPPENKFTIYFGAINVSDTAHAVSTPTGLKRLYAGPIPFSRSLTEDQSGLIKHEMGHLLANMILLAGGLTDRRTMAIEEGIADYIGGFWEFSSEGGTRRRVYPYLVSEEQLSRMDGLLQLDMEASLGWQITRVRYRANYAGKTAHFFGTEFIDAFAEVFGLEGLWPYLKILSQKIQATKKDFERDFKGQNVTHYGTSLAEEALKEMGYQPEAIDRFRNALHRNAKAHLFSTTRGSNFSDVAVETKPVEPKIPRSESRADQQELKSVVVMLVPEGVPDEDLQKQIDSLRTAATPEEAAKTTYKIVTVSGIAAVKKGLYAMADAIMDKKSTNPKLNPEVIARFAARLIATLSAVGEKKYSSGLVLPSAGDNLTLKPFYDQYLKVMRDQGGRINEIPVEGQMPADVMKNLKASGARVVSINPNRSLVPLNEQLIVPLVVAVPGWNQSVNEIFYLIMGDTKEVEDPLVRDYVEILKIVAAIHVADLTAGDPSLLLDADRLNEALIARLQMADGDVKDLFDISAGHSLTVKGVVAQTYLEVQTARELAKAA